MEFHISKKARDKYQFDEALFTLNGNVIFANFHASRVFAQKINQKQDLVHFPEHAIQSGQINAMGLIDEILHYVIACYREKTSTTIFSQALAFIENEIAKSEVDDILLSFLEEFPPLSVYRNELSSKEYLNSTTDSFSNRAITLEEMLMLWIANTNPAFRKYEELFDDSTLRKSSKYHAIIDNLIDFFEHEPPFGPHNQNLIHMLQSPSIEIPNSLFGQLEYIREHWGAFLGKYFYQLLMSLDLIKEEEKIHFLGSGPIPIPLYDLSAQAAELERFSSDKDWMPKLVLIAKNAYVWLDQLSKKYGRKISHLDQIPEEELKELSSWGFSGLWLIGIWERSQASERIKQLCGNPEAIASAYSLSEYSIANDLGGENAYQILNQRAKANGIRLASDMVPNHMGIDSSWVIQHPERFISSDYPPFPSYSFNGTDLSNNPAVSIFIEDHYYERTDAAVVFKRQDNRNGYAQYIYHGNDGTSMPWNDTAQLNYLNPDVRETVIQTIIEVAKKFSIIRFDAAMTLTKRHYQRLWFPEPGSGGDIPSRSEFGLTRESFNQLMPVEFWREVVDRVSQEVPDTLLLAEAFWLMEGYFVRTLGMHRVYNSAFMNMLRDEDNAKYRTVMKNTLEFDPEILKRFVNFMNNPDERTAVDQFGKDDKYFGICLMMATLPGLPMFGHGQIEGFTEKYGMEYKRSYWDETPDEHLINRHKTDIFPLLHKRSLFADIQNFLLYDFYTVNGGVNEDVFAYSNGDGDQRALVIYHNRYAHAAGWINSSVGFYSKSQSKVVQKNLFEGLNLSNSHSNYVIYRDQVANLEYLKPTKELIENGLYVELGAYKYHVFSDFRQVQDNEWQSYRRLHEFLNGKGVPSIDEALKTLILQPIQQPFQQIANQGYFDYLNDNRLLESTSSVSNALLKEVNQKMDYLINGIDFLTGSVQHTDTVITETNLMVQSILSLPILETKIHFPGSKKLPKALKFIKSGIKTDSDRWLTLYGWAFTQNLGQLTGQKQYEIQSSTWFDEWQLGKILGEAFTEMEIPSDRAWHLIGVINMLIKEQNWYINGSNKSTRNIVEDWLSHRHVQQYLGINRFRGTLWFNQEAFLSFVWWMMSINTLKSLANPNYTSVQSIENILGAYEIIKELIDIHEKSDYQVSKLLNLLD